MECPICQDQVYIPVSIICFPCFRRNEVHCHNFTRFCLSGISVLVVKYFTTSSTFPCSMYF